MSKVLATKMDLKRNIKDAKSLILNFAFLMVGCSGMGLEPIPPEAETRVFKYMTITLD
jgi:hypothetical protein